MRVDGVLSGPATRGGVAISDSGPSSTPGLPIRPEPPISLIETCKLNGVEPHTYLSDVISKIVNGIPVKTALTSPACGDPMDWVDCRLRIHETHTQPAILDD